MESYKKIKVTTRISERSEWAKELQMFVSDRYNFRAMRDDEHGLHWQYFTLREQAERWCRAQHTGNEQKRATTT